MVKQSLKQNSRKRKSNPLTRPVQKIKMNMNFDGQIGNFRSVRADIVTATNVAAAYMYIDCTSSSAMGSLGSAIANTYSEYVYESLTLSWLPGVAPGVADGGAQVYVAYYDNPEQIAALVAATTADKITAVKSTKNAKFFNAWEKCVYHVPLTRRRKCFDVNLTNARGADVDDRSTQGFVCIVAESPSAAVTLGKFITDTRVKLMRFNNIAT